MQCFRCQKSLEDDLRRIGVREFLEQRGLRIPPEIQTTQQVCGDCQDELLIAISLTIKDWFSQRGLSQ